MFTNVTLLYFLLLIPLSGFIAWLGDRIGHKSGKRRHTLFGLRPRHTAMVFTVGTGMCISLVSFALMCCLSKAFRVIVRDGVRLYDTNRELKHSNIALSEGNAKLVRVADQRQAEADDAERKRADALAAKALADAATKIAVAAEANALAQQKKAETEVGKALRQLAIETDSLQSAQHSLRSVQGTLKDRSASLKDANQRVALAQKQADAATTRVQLARKDADVAQENVQRVQRSAKVAIAQQAQTLIEQNKSLAALQKQYDDQNKLFNDQTKLFTDQKSATDKQREELAALNTQVSDSENRLRLIQVNTEALREHRITYQVGEEVDRIAIRPGYNVWRVEAILRAFVLAAAKKAEARGARKDKNGDSALVILPEIATTDADNATPTLANATKSRQRPLSEDERYDATIAAAAASIRTKNTDVVVLVSAVANAVAGEPVAIALKLYPNPIVFPADTQIGNAHINGKGSPAEIADALYAFLRTDVRPTLLHAGVIPASSGGSDSDTGPSLVNLSGDDWLHIMDRIRLAGDNARIVVTASQDMRAGDLPVPLRFDVKGVPSGIFREPDTR